MFDEVPLLIETEIGVREARVRFKELIEDVELRNRVVHLTRRGKRVGAIVSSDVAEGIAAIEGPGGPIIPGDLPTAIKLVEGLLSDNSANAPAIDPDQVDSRALVGACLYFVDLMLPGPTLFGGELPMADPIDGEDVKLVADLLVRKLYKRLGIRDIASKEFPLIAGALWAAQTQESAVEYRLRIPIGISPEESYIWIMALYELCDLINVIHGDGTAQEQMYRIEETEESFPDELGDAGLEPEPRQ